MEFQKRIRKIIKKHTSVFKALEEFEKTGELKTKKRMNFTIDRELSKQFREYCNKNKINMSKIIEDCIKKII